MAYDYIALQHRYPDEYVATRNGQVVAHATTLRELDDALRAVGVAATDVITEYVEPPDVVSIY